MAQTISGNTRLGGTSFLTVDGVTFGLGEDFSYRLSTPVRETKKGQTGVYGFKESPNQGFMKGTAFRIPGGPQPGDVGKLTNTTMIASLADGTVVTLRNGWSTEPPEVNTAEGSFTFNIESGDVSEDVSAQA